MLWQLANVLKLFGGQPSHFIPPRRVGFDALPQALLQIGAGAEAEFHFGPRNVGKVVQFAARPGGGMNRLTLRAQDELTLATISNGAVGTPRAILKTFPATRGASLASTFA